MHPWIKPMILEDTQIRLEPLHKQHEHGLIAAASDGELWNLWFTSIPKPDQTKAFIETALQQAEQGIAQAFAIINKNTGDVLGSTRFCNIDSINHRVEIGYTWYRQSEQRTGTNTSCKLLLLTHAFEELDCIAVEFRTNWHNHKSRTAIARLGAKQDGILRQHQIMPNGQYRDTVVFSIINSEWPAVKTQLQYFQQKHSEH